jgi:tetratricopeptide (TPR) repeat protein
MRDSAAELASQEKFVEADKIYSALINKILRTKRAKDDIAWDYASIEYYRLNRRASAIARLDDVMKTIQKDEIDAPVDTSYRNYFENYGAMCHNLGVDTMRVDRRLAYGYFERATAIYWSGRGKSYAFMAELTQSNADLAIKNGENALKFRDQLTAEQLKNVYKFLVDGYRSKRQMDKARDYFEKLKAMQ